MGDLSRNFSLAEFLCSCKDCDPLSLPRPAPELITALQAIRDAYGQAITITSGVRCEAKNRQAGGVHDSAHLTGHAADLWCPNSRDRFLLVDLALKANVHRIGLGRTFVHLDVDPTKVGRVLWLYPSK